MPWRKRRLVAVKTPLLSSKSLESTSQWQTVDDVVMGGISTSRVTWVDGVLRFEGYVSLEQNGGFCSARTEGQWELAGATEMIWTLRGTRRPFQVTIRTADIPESASFRHPFEPETDDRQDFVFKFDDFRLYRRGQQLSPEERLDPSRIVSVGILLADKTEGSFWLELYEIIWLPSTIP